LAFFKIKENVGPISVEGSFYNALTLNSVAQ